MNAIRTFNPDAHPEVTSVDGRVRLFHAAGLTWAAIRGGNGTFADDSTPSSSSVSIQADAATDKWQQLIRFIMLFDTSSLADDTTIASATLILWGRIGLDSLSINPSINIYASNPASNTAVVAGDYNSLGTTPLATAIAHSSWSQTGANVFTLNAAGLALITKTGITKLGARLVCDATDSEPAWSSGQKQSTFAFDSAEDIGTPPELRVVRWVDSGAGNFAVIETRLHYVDTSNNERYIPGMEIGDATDAAGNVAVVEERIHYVGATNLKERYWEGVLIGDAINPAGSIGVVETRLHYVDTSSKERYILGVPV